MDSLNSLFLKINEQILNPLIFLMFAAAMVYFLWGVAEFVRNPEEGENGRRHMMWGIIGIAIMISVWGIIRIIANTIGVDTSVIPR